MQLYNLFLDIDYDVFFLGGGGGDGPRKQGSKGERK